MMKVIYTGVLDVSEKKGGVIHFSEVANNLVKNGVDLLVVLPKYKCSSFYDGVFDEQVKVKYVNVSLFPKIIGYLFFEFSLFLFLFKKIVFKEIDVFYQRTTLLNFFCGLLVRSFGKRYIVELNGLIQEELEHQNVPAYQRKLILFFHKYNLRIAEIVITVTDGIKKYISIRYGLCSNKIHVVSNGANKSLFTLLPPDKELSKELKLQDSDIVLGYVGILMSWHALDILMSAYDKTVNPNIVLVIVGDGPLYDEIKAWSNLSRKKERIKLIGKVEYKRVAKYISIFDYCYMGLSKKPVDGGVSPLKFFEYMASGKAQIASDVPDINRIILENGIGSLFSEEEDLITIFDGLNKSNNFDPEKIRELFLTKYSWETISRKVFELCCGQ
jgi:glycosyltransferase involved in cell wall biosynthesis